MMQPFLKLLEQLELGLDADAIADALWLADKIGQVESVPSEDVTPPEPMIEGRDTERPTAPLPEPPTVPVAQVAVNAQENEVRSQGSVLAPAIPFQAPAAPALRKPLELSRALRPLMRKVPSRVGQVLDEEETAIRIAESRGQSKPWVPMFQPALERWLDLALVVEESRSMVIWEDAIAEFQQILERQGAFRTVRTWKLRSRQGKIELFKKQGQQLQSPKELLDPSGRRLILVVSDGMSQLWKQSRLYEQLKEWSMQNPVGLVQLLPERLWTRSALGLGFPVQLTGLVPGVVNSRLEVSGLPAWETVKQSTALTLPVITLEPEPMLQWAEMMAGMGSARAAGVVFDLAFVKEQAKVSSIARHPRQALTSSEAEELVQRFRVTTSPLARRLAVLMSTVPVSLPVVHLIQEAVLPASRQVHLAEVLMSGLLQEVSATEADQVCYDFDPQVRSRLQSSISKSETLLVLERVSQYIAQRAGLSIKSFAALLMLKAEGGAAVGTEVQQFAEISAQALRRLGGECAAFVDELAAAAAMEAAAIAAPTDSSFPKLQEVEFEIGVIEEGVIEEGAIVLPPLQPFEFTIATLIELVDIRREATVVIQREPGQARQYLEPLGESISLEMVSIPAGCFLMGSPKNEIGRYDRESPQHEVTVPEFFMGKYPVTQAQWRFVANLPEVGRSLYPDPSRFKGDNRPVEQVSWQDAVEFCDRLAKLTGRPYRLPSEVEWEYAYRVGTTTPFHFGKTITPDLANYNWSESYGTAKMTKEKDFSGTTPVGQFGLANSFGLYDMHGNVWEWCADHWHENYENAPVDGSVWIDSDADENASRVLRGGSWVSFPRNCRSATRYINVAGSRNYDYGFRVVCSVPRTL